MAYSSKILLDSTNSLKQRLTTFEVTFPRIVLAEFNTHRMFSRNAASSRAIPVKKMIEKVMTDPFIPVWWGKNQKGMEAASEILDELKPSCEAAWLRARDSSVKAAEGLIEEFDLHKQIANRLLEPFMWVTDIVTATEFENYYTLRRSPSAQPEIKVIADMMFGDHERSIPDLLGPCDWHIPMLFPEDFPTFPITKENGREELERLLKIATGRCARVSYLTHDGRRDQAEDIRLHDQLSTSGHWSPFEHSAKNMESESYFGNFKGWKQYRKLFATESGQ